jgi:very-short-patch-repair endonuclease
VGCPARTSTGRFKSRRQVWIGPYIADFACLEARLVIELDGAQHGETIDYDARRDRQLAAQGYRTLRFWNNDVMENLEGVLDVIGRACAERLPSPSHRFAAGPSLSPRGEGR